MYALLKVRTAETQKYCNNLYFKVVSLGQFIIIAPFIKLQQDANNNQLYLCKKKKLDTIIF